MAARRTGSWIAIGGATAAVAIGVWSASALGALTGLTATSPTRLAPHLAWTDDDTGAVYNVDRASGSCPGVTFGPVATGIAGPTFDDALPADGVYCYRVTGTGYTPSMAGDSVLTKEVRVDTTAPSTPAFFPVVPSTVRGSVQLAVTSNDTGGSGVTATSIAIDTVPFASGVASAAGSWNTAAGGYPDGPYSITAASVDAAGNPSAVRTLSVIVDNTPPATPSLSAQQNPVAGSPVLIWQNIPGETYTVFRNGVSQGTATSPWTDGPATPVPGTYDYSVVARDAVGNASAAGHLSVIVTAPSLTAPRSLSAASPTNSVPHLTWQSPTTFAVTSWQIYRDGVQLTTISDPSVFSFDDTGIATQGPHLYAVRAMSGLNPGDLSSSVSVTYDTTPPVLDPAAAASNPDGSISVTWPDATDPSPGAGVASYVVRRNAGPTPPSDPSSGTAVCTQAPPTTGCLDKATKNNTLYAYRVFAIDAAGNVSVRDASARSIDTQAPDLLAGVRIVSFDRTYARIGWDVPAFKDADADIAGYRVLMLRSGTKAPANANDGTVVCRNVDPKDNFCDAINLVTGKKVTFAVYAFDGVPNYSAPALISMTPHSIDTTPPHKPTKVRLTHNGLTYTLRWVSPRDLDLSKFRVTLYDKGPAKLPKVGKAVVTGRVLHATFRLKPGQVVYVNLFALDVVGNFSRVTKLIIAPGKIVPKSKHKVAKKKKKAASTKATATAANTAKKPVPSKP